MSSLLRRGAIVPLAVVLIATVAAVLVAVSTGDRGESDRDGSVAGPAAAPDGPTLGVLPYVGVRPGTPELTDVQYYAEEGGSSGGFPGPERWVQVFRGPEITSPMVAITSDPPDVDWSYFFRDQAAVPTTVQDGPAHLIDWGHGTFTIQWPGGGDHGTTIDLRGFTKDEAFALVNGLRPDPDGEGWIVDGMPEGVTPLFEGSLPRGARSVSEAGSVTFSFGDPESYGDDDPSTGSAALVLQPRDEVQLALWAARYAGELSSVDVLGREALMIVRPARSSDPTVSVEWDMGDGVHAQLTLPDDESGADDALAIVARLVEQTEEGWLEELPSFVLTPERQQALAEELVEGTPVPGGGSLTELPRHEGDTVDPLPSRDEWVLDRFGRLRCAWANEWVDARDADDDGRADDAADAIEAMPEWSLTEAAEETPYWYGLEGGGSARTLMDESVFLGYQGMVDAIGDDDIEAVRESSEARGCPQSTAKRDQFGR